MAGTTACTSYVCVDWMGIVITGDAFNAFVFMEVSSLSMYVLIAMGRDKRALAASFQYLIMGTIGATMYIIGAGLLYVQTGTLNLVDMGVRLEPILTSPATIAGMAFILVGLSLKLALFPLHLWLPNAYAYAPIINNSVFGPRQRRKFRSTCSFDISIRYSVLISRS